MQSSKRRLGSALRRSEGIRVPSFRVVLSNVAVAVIVPMVIAAVLAGCGQVITLPTATSLPPTATLGAGVTPGPTPRPTFTPAPYTPEPTSTATPTPTPIVYTIRRGDTLLAIAGMYGVSVTALQETNGIVDPRALRIDQQIIIPHDEEALLGGGEPTATPTPLPFAIENIHLDRTPMGGLWCLGEIHNTTTEYLDHVQVRVTLHDENREPLVTESAFVQLDLIAPDGRSPFALYFAEAPISFASYEAQPLSGVPAYLGSYYRDLEVRGVEAQADRYASYAVRGIVANVGPEDAVGVSLVVTAYDALGEVIGVREGIPEHNVVPRGGETTFQVELVPAGGPVVTYTIQALGQRILPTPSTSP